MKLKVLVVLICSILSFSSFPKVEPLGKELRGKGLYTWYFFDVYNAVLRGHKGDDLFEHPLSLELSYLRSLSGKDIAKQSAKELISIGRSKEEVKNWSEEMNQIFPDVGSGDSILANYKPESGIVFYLNRDKEIGKIKDKTFAKAFMDIWLSEKTSAEDLRKKLLGID